MNYRVLVRVMPRTGLLDPQGQAVESALHVLGFAGAQRVHVATPVTADYRIEVEDA